MDISWTFDAWCECLARFHLRVVPDIPSRARNVGKENIRLSCELRNAAETITCYVMCDEIGG